MSIGQIAAEVQAAVARARSLVGLTPEPTALSGAPLQSAAESVTEAAPRTADLTGQFSGGHHNFVTTQAHSLATASRIDATLEAQLSAASEVAHDAARQLAAIIEQTRTIAQNAATATSPAAQRSLLAALRSQVAAADALLRYTRQQAGELAGEIRALTYRSDPRIHGAGAGRDDTS